MSTIELPILASKQEQLKYLVEVLNKNIPEDYKKGIQLYRGAIDRDKQSTNKDIEAMIKSNVPKDFVITLHAPFIVTNPKPKYNFTTKKVEDMVQENILLAESINANSMIIHLNSVFYHPERLPDSSNLMGYFELFRWKNKWDNYEIVKKEVIDVAYGILKDIARKTKVKISVENMPMPLGGDITTDPTKLIYDPKLATYESIIEFLKEFSDFKNIGVCFDTAHYKISQLTLNDIIRRSNGNLTYNELKNEGFLGLYPERFSLQPDIKDVVKELIDRKVLFDLQIADTDKRWVKNSRLLREGLPIKNDNSGKELLYITKYVAENSPNTPISFDIEEEDYLNLKNQIDSLKIFFNYMNSKGL